MAIRDTNENRPENAESKSYKGLQMENTWKRANFLSKLCFVWMMPLFWKGMKKKLTSSDICQPRDEDLSEQVTDKLERKWFEELVRSNEKGKKPSLLKTLFRTFIGDYILDGVLLFIQWNLFKAFQPVFLALLVGYFVPNSTATRDMAYMYASGVVVIAFLLIFVNHHVTLRTQQLGMRLRIACCSLIYRKLLRLNNNSLAETTAGKLVNLMSNDVNRFDLVLIYLHTLWILPFNAALICYLIYKQVSTAALIGVASIIVQTIPVQAYMSKLTSSYRKLIAKRTDERVRIMNEIISGIQVIKMYAWEKPFEKVVSLSRAKEISVITKTSYLRGIFMSFIVFTERFTLYVTLLAYSLMGYRVTSATTFSLAQFYNTLQGIMAITFPTAITTAAEAYVTIKRLQEFLLLEERPDLEKVAMSRNLAKNIIKTKHKDESPYLYGKHVTKNPEEFGIMNNAFASNDDINIEYKININHATASWVKEQIILQDISLKVPQGKLFAIIGAVGAGKSSILQLLLNELIPTTGSVDVNGTLSYSSQEAWLFVATVRNNILFGLPYDARRYKEVVKVCALEKDFQQFPHGDQTLVGERGVSLSGGQRARINLARAIYRDTDIYLLDDPLSAVDAHVGRHLFNECIVKYLKKKTVILVTHQLHYLHNADTIVILKNGRIENVGTYEELASSGEDFANLLAALRETAPEAETDEKPLIKRGSFARSSRKSSGSIKTEMEKDHIEQEEIEEEQIDGKLDFSVIYEYCKASGSWIFFCFMSFVMILGQLTATLSDYWVTFWTNQESMQNIDYFNNSITSNNNISNREINVIESGNNSTSNLEYLPEFDIHDKIGPFTTIEYLYIYTIIIILCVIMTLSRSILFFKVCMRASKGLHDNMFNKILKGVMRFFDTNPSGRILNRFSKDMGAVDELLPRAVIEALQIFLVMISILILVSVSNIWMIIPVLVILVLFYGIFTMYLNTAQDIKRLEGITRSPVFSHVSATLNGLTTIRASDASNRLAVQFDKHQDLHTAMFYQYLSCSSTLGFWLDFICAIFVAVVSYSFIIFDTGNVLSGNVGLAISQSLILTGMLQYGVRQAAEIVSQFTSVERILQYNDIEHEKSLESGDIETPQNWPDNGRIMFKEAYLKYSDTDPPVLKNLNINIQSGWKVGIVGRTGAGKSSLISALFRLAKIEGLIQIDDVDTSQVALRDLRSKISIIPQEPVLFSASMRYNLDPFDCYEDVALWNSIEDVELKDAITSLDSKVSEGGSNFSLGQRQLICLARAVLRNNKILVLDEATANVDPQTDAFIQSTIRQKFKDCTVLTIAHRLNTIMDSDRVLVMDTGEMVEFDHPYNLLRNSNGHLYKMVLETGHEMAARLQRVAKEAFIASGGTPVDDDLKEDANSLSDTHSNDSFKSEEL